MRYEVITQEYDEKGRFVGKVEVFSDDETWRSGPSQVLIGAPLPAADGTLAKKLGQQDFSGDSPTKEQILAGLKHYAADHEPQADAAAAARGLPKVPRIVLEVGVIDAATGAKVGEPKKRDFSMTDVLDAATATAVADAQAAPGKPAKP